MVRNLESPRVKKKLRILRHTNRATLIGAFWITPTESLPLHKTYMLGNKAFGRPKNSLYTKLLYQYCTKLAVYKMTVRAKLKHLFTADYLEMKSFIKKIQRQHCRLQLESHSCHLLEMTVVAMQMMKGKVTFQMRRNCGHPNQRKLDYSLLLIQKITTKKILGTINIVP